MYKYVWYCTDNDNHPFCTDLDSYKISCVNLIILNYFNQTRSIWKMLGPFATTSRLTPIQQMSLAVLSRSACASTTTTTMRDRGDHYGPMEWAQWRKMLVWLQLRLTTWHNLSCVNWLLADHGTYRWSSGFPLSLQLVLGRVFLHCLTPQLKEVARFCVEFETVLAVLPTTITQWSIVNCQSQCETGAAKYHSPPTSVVIIGTISMYNIRLLKNWQTAI